MAQKNELPAEETVIKPGRSCLLNATGRHFLVKILDVADDTIRTSFPVKDYLVPGMFIDLEFHKEDGYLQCYAQVLRPPKKKGDGVVLERPAESHWNVHRDSNRVKTDLTVHVRDLAHPRSYDAGLINVSSGGSLIQTRAPLYIPAQIEIVLSLPGEPQHTVVGRVVHVGGREGRRDLFGVRFVDLAENAYNSVMRYVGQALTRGHG